MSAIQMILHASALCADTGRTMDSVFDAIVSEVGELAEEKRIFNGMSYKKAGPDGLVGESVDVLASNVDYLSIVLEGCSEDKIKERLKPKLIKWLENTGTTIPDDDPYFSESGYEESTFGDLMDGFWELGYDFEHNTSENGYVIRCQETGRCMDVGTLSEAKVAFTGINLCDTKFNK